MAKIKNQLFNSRLDIAEDWKVVQQKNRLSTERNNTENYRKEHAGCIRHDKWPTCLKLDSWKEEKENGTQALFSAN